MTQPTDRSMPPEMMTNVCPRPISRTETMVLRMGWVLRRLRKLMSCVSADADREEGDEPEEEHPRPRAADGEHEPPARSIADAGPDVPVAALASVTG